MENYLISKCKNGDGEAFRKLINIYRTKLYGYLLKLSGSKDEADEMLQQTLIKVWEGIIKYKDEKKFSSWLFTIAHNVAMDNFRKNKLKNNKTMINLIESELSSDSPEQNLITNETINLINKAVENLSYKQKTVFLLRQHAELPFRIISEITNEPLNTVLSHMHYAVKKIKKEVELEHGTREK